MPGAYLTIHSNNSKTGDVATTATSRKSCPICPLYQVCYGKGPLAYCGALHNYLVTHPEIAGLNKIDIAKREASLILAAISDYRAGDLRLPAKHPMRLHVVGDATTTTIVKILARACKGWPGPVWTYTHAWREVLRSAWGRISILASIESYRDGMVAIDRGYMPAIVVAEFPDKVWDRDGVHWIACPAQWYEGTDKERNCKSCRLCWKSDQMCRARVGVALLAHGTQARKTRELIATINAVDSSEKE